MENKKIKLLFTTDAESMAGVQKSIEKVDESGKKRRYLYGVSSGAKIDGHGERMTEQCIKSMQAQAESGNVLLYPDIHGIRATQDMGILTKATIADNGDWFTEYRLYDEEDGFGPETLNTCEKAWRQINGLPPYKKPIQRGFSIEGYIPQDGLASIDGSGKRVISNVILDGVLLVPRPAYKPSVAQAICKSLGEILPSQVRKAISRMQTSIAETIKETEQRDDYNKQRWQIENAFFNEIDTICRDPNITEKTDALENLFDEFKGLMVPVLLSNLDLFSGDPSGQDLPIGKSADDKIDKAKLLKQLEAELSRFAASLS